MNTRPCEHKGCDLAATYSLVWTRPMYLCGFHAWLMVATGEEHGFIKPRETMRLLEPHERLVADDPPSPPMLLRFPIVNVQYVQFETVFDNGVSPIVFGDLDAYVVPVVIDNTPYEDGKDE